MAKKSGTSKAYRRALKRYREMAGQVPQVGAELSAKRRQYLREKIGKPAPGYVSGDAFYQTPEWKELRYKALKKSNGACVCCGARRGGGVVLHVDHIKPRYKFPELSLSLSNLQVLCADCNQAKGAWDQTEFKPWGDEFYPAK